MSLPPLTFRKSAFTLIEVLVSSVLIVLLMGMLMYSVDQMRKTITTTTSKVNQFQAARTAFESMTRNLSQATLNTYWDLNFETDSNGKQTTSPVGYRRQSDLHFITGKASQANLLGGDEKTFPTHSVFFQAPLGVTYEEEGSSGQGNNGAPRKYRNLGSLLNVVGYYIKWDGEQSTPPFLDSIPGVVPPRYRFRFMEVVQPAETVMIYNTRQAKAKDSHYSPSSPYAKPTDWIQVALGKQTLPPDLNVATKGKAVNYSRVLAENIVAMVILPKLAQSDRKTPDTLDLAPSYEYDSRPEPAYNAAPKDNLSGLSSTVRKQLHQLPPILQVTVVAIDEDSARRLQTKLTQGAGTTATVPTPPGWSEDLFKSVNAIADFNKDLGDMGSASTNSKSLIARLIEDKMNFRVFTSDVVLRGSKWTKAD